MLPRYRLQLARPRRHRSLAAACTAALVAGCEAPEQPLPQPFPANIDIATQPSNGAVVAASAADSIVFEFSRSMDTASLGFVPRMSFLLPLSIERFEGRWSDDARRVVFDLGGFPVQPGSLYEAVFAGLRTRDGDLYNMGPLRFHFRTGGEPDLFPLRPQSVVASRTFCHRAEDTTECSHTSTLEIETGGDAEVAWRQECGACGLHRRDFFHRNGARIEWLGYDLLDSAAAAVRGVRWPRPPALLSLPATRGRQWSAPAQTAPDGTHLAGWKVTVGEAESPAFTLAAAGLAVQLVFSECTVLDLEYALTPAGGAAESRRERWWLYAGVGLVRREIRATLDAQSYYELQTYTPVLPEEAATPAAR